MHVALLQEWRLSTWDLNSGWRSFPPLGGRETLLVGLFGKGKRLYTAINDSV